MTATPLELRHALRVPFTRDERARRNFTSGLRGYVLNDMAQGLRRVYARAGTGETTPAQVHTRLRGEEYFRFYSALRVASQDMVYQTVRAAIERAAPQLPAVAGTLGREQPLGSLELDPRLPVPRSVAAIDIHLMPGSYHTEHRPDDLTAGAIYDNRLAVSSFGLMGGNLDDIGQTMARFVQQRFPDFAPLRIVDLGCTIAHNTGAWKDNFPGAEVHGIDVAAPVLRYGLARARSQGRALHLHQMNAESLAFPDASFDLVFSSMFLHEVPRAGIARVLAEAHRVLRPGGLMLHMELPPNRSLAPYDAFYLDWDGWYNNEPFYRPYRALDPRAICARAGFAAGGFFEAAVPSWEAAGGEGAWLAALSRGTQVDSAHTGRLASGVNWYCFGARR
jgi:ubiquinone/menaquinone biosynthesis C-methylase UbiE